MNKHRHQPIVLRKHQEQDRCAEVEEEDGDDAAASEHVVKEAPPIVFILKKVDERPGKEHEDGPGLAMLNPCTSEVNGSGRYWDTGILLFLLIIRNDFLLPKLLFEIRKICIFQLKNMFVGHKCA